MNWLGKQWSWVKGFFDEDDKATYKDEDGHNPSHKNLIGIAMIIFFGISYMKVVYYLVAQPGQTPVVPDLPPGWQLVILGILGIRALQSGATAYIKSKNGTNGQEQPQQGQEIPPVPKAPGS